MYIDLRVQGDNGALATARLFVNFQTNAATLIPLMGWPKTCMQVAMTFSRGANGVLYFSNQDTNRFGDGHGFTLRAAPESEQDQTHLWGFGEMRSTESLEFNTALIAWQVPFGLSEVRQEILDIIKKLGLTKNPADKPSFPNGPPSQKTRDAMRDLWIKQHPNGPPPPTYKKVTNCGELPGHIFKQIAGDLPKDIREGLTFTGKSEDKVKVKATDNMTAWKEYALRVEAVRKAAGTIWHPWRPGCGRPQPGDVYVLTNSAGGSRFEHVGVIVDSSGPIWTCADSGQTIGNEPYVDNVQQTGFSACLRNRAYDPEKGTVQMLGVDAKIIQSDTGTRFLMGWVDVDALFQRITIL